MTDKELFKKVFDRVADSHCSTLYMSGTVVYYMGKPKFDIDGYSLGCNLRRLADILDDIGIYVKCE